MGGQVRHLPAPLPTRPVPGLTPLGPHPRPGPVSSAAMAEKAREQAIIDAPVEPCSDTLVDFERYPEWAGDLKQATVVERRRRGAGRRRRVPRHRDGAQHHLPPALRLRRRAGGWPGIARAATSSASSTARYHLRGTTRPAPPKSSTSCPSTSSCPSPASSSGGRRHASSRPRSPDLKALIEFRHGPR